MATPDRPRFEKVTSISSPGQFMFATDLVNRSDKGLANYGSITDVVLGERPLWELTLVDLLMREFQGTEWIHGMRQDEGNPDSGFLATRWLWMGQSGRICINGEYFEIHNGRDPTDARSTNFLLQAINPDGRVEHEDETNDQIKGGMIEVEQFASKPKELFRGKPFWRATIRLEGQAPKQPIQKLIDLINRDIIGFKIPVWRDLHYASRLIPPVILSSDSGE